MIVIKWGERENGRGRESARERGGERERERDGYLYTRLVFIRYE